MKALKSTIDAAMPPQPARPAARVKSTRPRISGCYSAGDDNDPPPVRSRVPQLWAWVCWSLAAVLLLAGTVLVFNFALTSLGFALLFTGFFLYTRGGKS